VCHSWKQRLAASTLALQVRRNYPYQGVSAGLTSSLRKRFEPNRYLGIEVELNQGLLLHPKRWRALLRELPRSLEALLAEPAPARHL
jgi:hypothetical protein